MALDPQANAVGAIIEALAEPALLVRAARVVHANRAARELLGDWIVGTDVRLAIRQPEALELILGGIDDQIEVVGIGGSERSWEVHSQSLGDGARLIRLADRSASRAAERMRTDFVANASHELRTPLSTIIGYAETLAEDGALDEGLRSRFGNSIHLEARRMLRIVEDLMSLSRIEADRFFPPRESVSLDEIARIAADNAQMLADKRGCTIALDIEPGLGLIAGDFSQLLQLFDNLIGNAIRYGCGPRPCTVRVTVRRDGSEMVIRFSDLGEGIAPEHLPRLTERFYRVDTARSREAGGTGLGLAIVKHIVERHRGSLDIRSTLGRGTEVTVRLRAGPTAPA